MYVRRTYTTNHPKILHELLISPGLGTEPGVDPKCWPPGLTPSEKPWRVNNWTAASKQKLLLGVGLSIKIYLWGAHPNPKPPGSLDQSARAVPGSPRLYTKKLKNRGPPRFSHNPKYPLKIICPKPQGPPGVPMTVHLSMVWMEKGIFVTDIIWIS